MKMLRNLPIIAGFLICGLGFAQTCPNLISPSNGAVNVPVDAILRWSMPSGADAMIISLGTTPDGVDILNRRTSNIIDVYQPEMGLPENTTIYLNIILRIDNGPSFTCTTQSFTTGSINSPPGCAVLSEPANGEFGVPVTSNISWRYAPRATGYLITVGSTPGGNDIADRIDVGNRLTYNPPQNLPLNALIYVSVIPYNDLGQNLSCQSFSFSTSDQTFDCTPHRPDITFPSIVGLCEGESFADVTSTDTADDYQWFLVDANGNELLISNEKDARLRQVGNYRLVLTENVGSVNNLTGCASVHDFKVVVSKPPEITNAQVERLPEGLRIEINARGNSLYEYALNESGPYQASNVFSGLPLQNYTAFVRDVYGCGIAQKEVARNLSAADFPPFFTPNGDGINDFWQFDPPTDLSDNYLESLTVFDRYGNFIAQVEPGTQGWDGSVNGKPLPPSSYWFKAISVRRETITGYFVLKR